MKHVTLFGFGSLMDKKSLVATTPGATGIRPAYIKGFLRDFSLWDDVGWTQTNLDVAGEAFCALDIHLSERDEDIVNGIVFEIPEDEMQQLRFREKDYELITTTIYDWETNLPIGKGYVFSGNKHNGKYVKDSPAQQRYWKICCDAAQSYGNDFYKTFVRTTKI